MLDSGFMPLVSKVSDNNLFGCRCDVATREKTTVSCSFCIAVIWRFMFLFVLPNQPHRIFLTSNFIFLPFPVPVNCPAVICFPFMPCFLSKVKGYECRLEGGG